MNSTREVRSTLSASANFEVRQSGSGRTVSGTAIVFNSKSQDLGGFREIIAPGSINLQRDRDILALYNHNSDRVLGRTTSGTLKLSLSSTGLDFSLDLPTSATDVQEALARRDVHGCSFGFSCDSDSWSQDANGIVRTVEALTLYEVAVCASPAYLDTSAALRSAPDAIRARLKRDDDTEEDRCDCSCAECLDGDCADCSDPDCADDGCVRCGMQSRSALVSCLLRRRRY